MRACEIFVGAVRSSAFGACLALVALAAIKAPLASDTGKTCPTPGTKMMTSTGVGLLFLPSDGLTCNIKNLKSGRTLSRYALVWDSNRIAYDEGKPSVATLWPLAAGKTLTFDTHPEHATIHQTFKVAGPQSVTVPAGTFNVLVVTHEEMNPSIGQPSGRYDGILTYYVLPQLGYFVKVDYKVLVGAPSKVYASWEATSITAP